jgi:hypothetical protein
MTGFVPGRLLEELISGSYESQIEKLSLAVTEGYKRFGGRGGDVQLIATFPGRVLVVNESGEFYRAAFQELDDGSFSFAEIEPIDIPVMSKPSELQAFVSESAGVVISSLFSGNFEDARGRMRELVRSSQFARPASPVDVIKDQLEEVFDEGRPWRKLYEQHGTDIRRFMWGASGASFRHAPKPKYQKLYHDGLGESATGYHGAVSGDLTLLSEKISKLWERTQDAWAGYDGNLGLFKAAEISSIAESFEDFAQDYIDELKMVAHLVERASQDSDSTNTYAMAMIYDAVAKRYPDLEVAGRLLQRAATELAA